MEKEYSEDKRKYIRKKKTIQCAVFLVMTIFLFVEFALYIKTYKKQKKQLKKIGKVTII